MSTQFIDHRLRLIFARNIIDTDTGAGVTEREGDRAPDSRACSSDDRFLPFEQLAIFRFGNNRLRQITEILEVRHFRFRAIGCFRWHRLHKSFWFADSSGHIAIPYKLVAARSVARDKYGECVRNSAGPRPISHE